MPTIVQQKQGEFWGKAKYYGTTKRQKKQLRLKSMRYVSHRPVNAQNMTMGVKVRSSMKSKKCSQDWKGRY